jgi:hypothetical protein
MNMVDGVSRRSVRRWLLATLFLGLGGCATVRSTDAEEDTAPANSADDSDAGPGKDNENSGDDNDSTGDGDSGDSDSGDGDSGDGDTAGDGDTVTPDNPDWEPAGNSACGKVPVSGSTALIDGLEENNDAITVVDHRNGYWYSYKDDADSTSTVIEPAIQSGGANNTARSIHITGKSAAGAEFGPGFGFDLHSVGDDLTCPYDGSEYGGVRFYIRATGATTIDVAIPTQDTIAKADGGTCTSGCDNHFFKQVEVTASFQAVTIKWTELAQAEDGADDFDPSRITGIAWMTPVGVTFDLVIDEVSFVP